MSTLRNVAIILVLAAAVVYLPGGGTGAAVASTALSFAFAGGLAWFAARLYLENRTALLDLSDGQRLGVYAALGIIALTLTATGRLWDSSAGVIAWFVLLGGALAGLLAVWRATRAY